LKKYLTTPPTLAAPEPHETLHLYISTTSNMVSMAIIIEWEESDTNHNDVVVKTREDEGLISNLTKTIDNLRKFKIKLNPEKCTFGVSPGKLLRYMVSHRGIDPNPEKVSAITKMKLPESLHDV
jgi:hypothetical protein